MTVETGYAIHPLADLIPKMGEAEYADLVKDIAANGQLQPILIYDHMVLDGRHRMRACVDLGIDPRLETYEGDEPAAHVLSLNLKRRHLSASQRAMIATDFLPHLEEEAQARRVLGLRRGDAPAPAEIPCAPAGAHGKADRAAGRAGQMVGVSRNSVDRAKRVTREAPDLVDAVRSGELTVTGADAIVKERAKQTAAPHPETGKVSGRSVERIAFMGGGLKPAVDDLHLTKSCGRLTEDERSAAIGAALEGISALNALVKALRAVDR